MTGVVVTGLGVVAPGGIGVKAFWELLCAGRTATRPITAFDASRFRSRIAAQVDFDPALAGLSHREIRRLDRATQFALVATRETLKDSGLEPERLDPTRIGVSLGTAVGSTCRLESEYLVLSDTGRQWTLDHHYAGPHLYDHYMPGSMAAELAWETNAQGPVAVISAGCTSGLDAIGHATDLIREGTADIMLTGGTDAPISPITLASFDAIKATSPTNNDPEHALRPFDRTRNGFVLGEGAAMLTLESETHARTRGAHIYAHITAHASRSNAHHMTGLHPDATEMAAAITAALNQAKLPTHAIDYVNAHGTATKQNDRHETTALKTALGHHAYQTPTSSIKSMIGHSLGAIGAIETTACALALQHNTIPPTANLHHPDPELDLDYVPHHPRQQHLNTILNLGSGFGGFQTAIILTRTGPP
jgi:minimal PKS ketosynthase (KS/KS alpha)